MPPRRLRLPLILLALAAAPNLAAADDPKPLPTLRAPSKALPEPQPAGPKRGTDGEIKTIDLAFDYGSEKQRWIEAVTKRFNESGVKVADGRSIKVVGRPSGSGEIIDRLLSGAEAAGNPPVHIVSPASQAFLVIGNASSNEANTGVLTGEPTPLVRSPIVLAMWREEAEAIGFGKRPITWREAFDFARSAESWRKIAGANAAPFKLGHTDPLRSNSGLHALFLIGYAAKGSYDSAPARGDVVNNPEFEAFVREVESAVPSYPASTGYLMDEMIKRGPSGLTAAVVYENLVVDANQDAGGGGRRARFVAIYPPEGTFPSEHPIAVVERPWVTPAHREAAKAYTDYLRSPESQREAGRFGFRPADASAPPGERIRNEFGAQPGPTKDLALPPASVIRALQDIWSKAKNPNASGS